MRLINNRFHVPILIIAVCALTFACATNVYLHVTAPAASVPNAAFFPVATLTIAAGSDGTYVISGHVTYDVGGVTEGVRGAVIMVNSNWAGSSQGRFGAGQTANIDVQAALTLKGGDVVTLNAYQASGGPVPLMTGDGKSDLSAVRIWR